MDKNRSYFRIDWSELREVLRKGVRGDFSDIKREPHKRRAAGYLEGSGWQGYTRGQITRWLDEGYVTDAMHGLEDMIPPIREKRKYVFSEDGDEYHHDMMLSGDDNFTSSFTKRETIPGVAIEAEIMFSSGVEASVINAYTVWLCKIAYSLESAGIDTEITLDFPSKNLGNDGRVFHNVVRVKKENEASDFFAWSPMLSPASFRCFGFIVGLMHCDREKVNAHGAWGEGMRQRSAWKIEYDAERRVIVIQCPYMSSNSATYRFPAEDMTRQFRAALLEMQGKVTAS